MRPRRPLRAATSAYVHGQSVVLPSAALNRASRERRPDEIDAARAQAARSHFESLHEENDMSEFSRRRIGGASPSHRDAADPASILPQPGEDLTGTLVTALDEASANRVYEARRQQVQGITDRASCANT